MYSSHHTIPLSSWCHAINDPPPRIRIRSTLLLIDTSLFRTPLLPRQLPELIFDLVLEVVEGRRTGPYRPQSATFRCPTARLQRTSSSVRGIHGRQAVNLAIDVGDGAVEQRAADKLQKEASVYGALRRQPWKVSSQERGNGGAPSRLPMPVLPVSATSAEGYPSNTHLEEGKKRSHYEGRIEDQTVATATGRNDAKWSGSRAWFR